ncbi:hypothetical protein HJ526_02740 [Donghicola sp. C2-DW-16]|uniref:Uncharacterized protein n=1 Tax=Donghicola mangrovi TaxID=2729614 RepID=A0A850PZC0_9RHOB|nr:hypothetical protein [Donghicola mangrovi]NVO22084.1 hypothetical protein [Donghicola mangrovi]NVO26325.1 hypothetical protein [Donghicola mangrovi]
MARHHQSVGTLISTVSFAGVSVALMNEAVQAEGIRAIGLWITAIMCLAAALRYRIADLVEKWRRD